MTRARLSLLWCGVWLAGIFLGLPLGWSSSVTAAETSAHCAMQEQHASCHCCKSPVQVIASVVAVQNLPCHCSMQPATPLPAEPKTYTLVRAEAVAIVPPSIPLVAPVTRLRAVVSPNVGWLAPPERRLTHAPDTGRAPPFPTNVSMFS